MQIPYLLLDTYLASQCKLFVVILSDAYCNTKSCRREFEHAVQSGKFMIPVLIPEFDEDDGDDIPEEHENKTGWMGPVFCFFVVMRICVQFCLNSINECTRAPDLIFMTCIQGDAGISGIGQLVESCRSREQPSGARSECANSGKL